jgi:hydrogenase maturation protease
MARWKAGQFRAPLLSHVMNTIIIGLGNPILGDDGVGWKVAEEVGRRLSPDSPVIVNCLSLGGISLMERLIGYDRAILIDTLAVQGPSGSVLSLSLGDLPNYSAYHTSSLHDTTLQNALEMGRRIGAKLPSQVVVVGITARQVFEFSEHLTEEIQAAVPQAVKAVMSLLEPSDFACSKGVEK